MSDLTYTASDPTNHTWMTTGDSLLEITGGTHDGKCVLVNIMQNNIDTNLDGTDDQVNVKVSAKLVNKTTGATVLEGTAPVQIPAKVESALLSAISEGTVVVSTWLANMIDDAIHRTLRQQAALGAINMIPQGG